MVHSWLDGQLQESCVLANRGPKRQDCRFLKLTHVGQLNQDSNKIKKIAVKGVISGGGGLQLWGSSYTLRNTESAQMNGGYIEMDFVSGELWILL